MISKAMYFGKSELYQMIREQGGKWNDSKDRPLVCMFQSTENPKLFWAVPVGNWNHRDAPAKTRIENFLNIDSRQIESCYYHVGKTTTKTIFFLSDVIPIADKYISRSYDGYDGQIYVIKNSKLISELSRKLKRILKYENANPNFFRQHITDIKLYLLAELENKENKIKT